MRIECIGFNYQAFKGVIFVLPISIHEHRYLIKCMSALGCGRP